MKKISYILIIFILIIPSFSQGQSTVKLYGVVVDAETGRPLEGVNITIAGTVYGTSSNRSGRFEFEQLLEGNYTVTAKHIGYVSQHKNDIYVPRDHPVRIEFNLMPKILQFDDIEITADRVTDIIRNTTHQINEAQIKESNVRTVGELLEAIPGIAVMSSDGNSGSKKISIRGSQTNQVLVLLDDVPLNNKINGDVDLSIIPVNMIEQVVIIKGGSSQKYGSGAIGGVIKIRTKKSIQNKIDLSTGYGSFNSYWFNPSISGNMDTGYGSFGLTASYQYQYTDGDYPYSYTNSSGIKIHENRLNAEAMNRNGFARLQYSWNDHRILVNSHRILSDRGIPGKIDSWTPFAHTHLKQTSYGASYEYVKKKYHISINSQYSMSETENMNLFPPTVELKYRRNPPYHYKYLTDTFILRSAIAYTITKSWNAELAYDGQAIKFIDKDYLSIFGAAINEARDLTHGLYMHHDYERKLGIWQSRAQIAFDFRYDHMKMKHQSAHRTEEQYSPGVTINLTAGKSVNCFIQTTLSRSFRAPTFADLFYQDARIQGKSDLLPEKSLNKELIFGFETSSSITISGNVHLFSQKIDDMIVWRLGSFEVFRPFNTNAHITGQEYNFQIRTPSEFCNLNVNYLSLRALNKNKNVTLYDQFIPYRPQHTLKAQIEFKFQGLNWNTNYRYIGKRFITEANTKAMPHYDVYDSTLKYTFNDWIADISLKISVLNLFDEKYEIIRDMPLPGREIRIGMDIKF